MLRRAFLLSVVTVLSACPPAAAATLTTLVDFVDSLSHPNPGLAFGVDGNLYGLGLSEPNSFGTVIFKVDPVNGGVLKFIDLAPQRIEEPVGRLIPDRTGKFYGIDLYDKIFSYDVTSDTSTLLTDWHSAPPPAPSGPRAGFVPDGQGALYGTTNYGGPDDVGTIVKFDLASGQLTTVAVFDEEYARDPLSELVFDAQGNLYGTTESGGYLSGAGTIFKLDPKTNSLTIVYRFDYVTSGGNSRTGLVSDAAGMLYGVNWSDGGPEVNGQLGQGTVYKFDPVTNTLTNLVTFGAISGAKGANPAGELIVDAAGNLFGVTRNGGECEICGTVFKVDSSSGALTTLVEFDITNGAEPQGRLVADASGNLFGTTYWGGSGTCGSFTSGVRRRGCGTVFKVTDAGFVPWTATSGGSLAPDGTLTTRNTGATVLNFTSGLPLPTVGTSTGVIIDSGSIENVRRAPAGVTGDYLSVGYGEITFDFGGAVEYVGLYAGSPDEYNFIEFFAESGVAGVLGAAIDVPGFGTSISGTELANVFGSPLYGNEYWNFTFTALQDVRYMRLSSPGNAAFEIGEIAYEIASVGIVPGQAAVPAPGAAWLLMGGLALAAAGRRRLRG